MYQSEAPPIKTIAADLPDKDIDEELNSTIHPRPTAAPRANGAAPPGGNPSSPAPGPAPAACWWRIR